MPSTVKDGSDFHRLTTSYGYDAKQLKDSAKANIVLSGSYNCFFGPCSFSDVGSCGYYWSNQANGTSMAYELDIRGDSINSYYGGRSKDSAVAIRCVAQ